VFPPDNLNYNAEKEKCQYSFEKIFQKILKIFKSVDKLIKFSKKRNETSYTKSLEKSIFLL